MKLSISVETSGEILSVDIAGSLTLEDFNAYLQAETDIEPKDQRLKLDGIPIEGATKTLDELNMKENDLLVLSKIPSNEITSSIPPVSESSQFDNQIEFMRQQFLRDPHANSQLKNSNPSLHSILGDFAEFKRVMLDQLQQFQNGNTPGMLSQEQRDEVSRLQNNPDDPASQARILELIRQEQIDENMKLAYEITPESFAYVNMLYIDIVVNGKKVQAFVDSGAQSTIISPKLADEIGISRLIDKRFQGEARGVGSQTIEGKIHSVPIKIGNSPIEIPCSFMVIDTQVDLLFGLDMLRRHKCVIDLERDMLVVGGNIETKFLHESEIKNNAFGKPNSGGSGLGGNIFSDAPIPANSTPGLSGSPLAISADAARKRRNTTQSREKKIDEEKITQLLNLGFSRSEAISALEQTNGNVEMAASLLFQ